MRHTPKCRDMPQQTQRAARSAPVALGGSAWHRRQKRQTPRATNVLQVYRDGLNHVLGGSCPLLLRPRQQIIIVIKYSQCVAVLLIALCLLLGLSGSRLSVYVQQSGQGY